MVLNEINGIKRIDKYNNLNILVSVPLKGITRNLTLGFARAFKRLGANVEVFDTTDRFDYYMKILDNHLFTTKKEFYANLLNEFISHDLFYKFGIFKPDIFFGVSNSYYDPIALETFKKLNTKIIFYSIDAFNEQAFIDKTTNYTSQYFSIAPAKKNKEVNQKIEYLQPGCDIFIYSPKPVAKKYIVSFIGSATKYRIKVISELISSVQELHIWGNGWNEFGNVTDKLIIHDIEVDEKLSSNIYNSSYIVLNLPQMLNADHSVPPWLNTRLFDAAGCGSCVIAHKRDLSCEAFEENEEIILFDDIAEISEKIDKLLNDLSFVQYIGQKAGKKVRQMYSLSLKAEKIIEKVL